MTHLPLSCVYYKFILNIPYDSRILLFSIILNSKALFKKYSFISIKNPLVKSEFQMCVLFALKKHIHKSVLHQQQCMELFNIYIQGELRVFMYVWGEMEKNHDIEIREKSHTFKLLLTLSDFNIIRRHGIGSTVFSRKIESQFEYLDEN